MTLILALIYFSATVSVLLFVLFVWAKIWPSVSAIITHKEVKRISVNGRYYYKPELTYRYSVGGVDYCSNTIFLGGGRSYPDESKALNLWPGEKVNVSFCPVRPAFSYLVVDSRLFWGLPMISAICVAFIILIV